MRRFLCLFWMIALVASPRAGTLEDIQSRGVVTCGVEEASAGLSVVKNGDRHGLAIELCRMAALAVLGRADAVAFVAVSAADAHLVLQAEEADVLLLARPWTFAAEAEQGLLLVQPLLEQAATGQVFGPVVRQGDDSWFLAWRWLLATAQRDAGQSWPEDHGAAGVALGLQAGWNTENGVISGFYEKLLNDHIDVLTRAGWRGVAAAAR